MVVRHGPGEHGREDAPGIGEQRVFFGEHFANASPAQNETRGDDDPGRRDERFCLGLCQRGKRAPLDQRGRVRHRQAVKRLGVVSHAGELAAGQTRRRRCDELRNQSQTLPFGEIAGGVAGGGFARDAETFFQRGRTRAQHLPRAHLASVRGGPAPVRLARQLLVRARDSVQRDAQDRESATSGRGGVRRRLVRAEAFRRRARRERVRQDKCGDPRGDIRLAYRVSRIPAFFLAVRVEGVAREASRLLSLAREAEFENIAGVRLRALRSLYQTLRQRARDGARHSSAARLARDGHRAAHETDASTLALARGVHLVQVRRSRVEKRGMQRRRRGGGPHGGVFAELRRCEKHVVRRLEDGTRRGREPRLPRLGSGKKIRLARVRGDERHQVRDGSKRRHRRVGAETRGGGQKLRRAAYERARDVVSDVERRLRVFDEVEVLHRKHRKHRGRRRPRRGNRERRVFGRRVRILLERDERLFDPDQAHQSLRDGDV